MSLIVYKTILVGVRRTDEYPGFPKTIKRRGSNQSGLRGFIKKERIDGTEINMMGSQTLRRLGLVKTY